DRAGSRVVHGEDGSSVKVEGRRITRARRRGEARVPASNRAGFGGKNEAGSRGEVRGPVKDYTGRPAWDGDDQRKGLTNPIIDGSDLRVVIRDPERSYAREGSRAMG